MTAAPAPTARRAAFLRVTTVTLAATALLAACGTATPGSSRPPVAAATVPAVSASPAASAAASSSPSASASSSASSSSSPARSSGAPVAAKGVYIDDATYRANPAAYSGTRVVLFFHAPWCPSCRANEKDIQARVAAGSLPPGLTIVKVDYDSSTQLKARYGVRQQDTFVQVDAAGNAVGRPVTDPNGVDGLVAALA